MIFAGTRAPCLGKFGKAWQFRGTVPEELTVIKTNAIGQRYRDSKSYDSMASAVKAAKESGLNTFDILGASEVE